MSKDLFRNALPPDDGYKGLAIKRKLIAFVVAYSRHMQFLRLDKLSPMRFRGFINKLNIFINTNLSTELGQAWQQLIRQTNQEAMQEINKKEAALKKHAVRIAFLRALIAYLPGENNIGASGADA